MKKFWRILGITALLIAALSVTGYANFITDSGNSFAAKEEFELKWKDVSKFGTIEPGKKADMVIWNTEDMEMLCYRMGSNLAGTVIKHGTIVKNNI